MLAELPWQPDLICSFSGYDGHGDDCGRRITEWTEQDFERMTRLVLDRAALSGDLGSRRRLPAARDDRFSHTPHRGAGELLTRSGLMPFQLTKSSPRLWSLDAGVAMVVTDLHGDWDTYARYRDRFIALRAAGQADCLIFTGDLIHREPDAGADRSLDIVLDILALRERYGDAIISLCGNHELPHLYGFVLGKGSTEYTPSFEAALSRSGRRGEVLELFESLPFFIRTAAGVSIAHAGASAPLADGAQAARLFDWDHQALRAWAEERLAEGDRAELRSGYAHLSGESSYDAMARRYLAVSGPADPRHDDLLRGFFITAHPDFRIVRRALFTRCEQEDSEEAYAARLAPALERLSVGYAPQHMLVAGHMATPGGHTVVAERHLRLASGAHAHPAASRAYFLVDTARSIDTIDDFLSGLQPIA